MLIDHFNYDCDPNVLVTTNSKRICIFGPSLHSSAIRDWQYSWTRLSSNSGSDVIGIFYDALSIPPGGVKSITNIGITQDTKLGYDCGADDLPKIPMLGCIPPIKGCVITSGYLSIGTLCHTQRLRVRKIWPRFTGTTIQHDDGSIEVLGQWDYPEGLSISEIYSRSNGVLMSTAFRLIGEVDALYVDRIHVAVDNQEPSDDLQINQQLRVFVLTDPSPVRYRFDEISLHD
ncbi:MAG: hypothetical protein M1818_007229 [Claussenomyces sp. TS43310]|nr:MAG: hypothetical protein M1818_007229 [Claussenomyces sp. TS43310]